MIHLPKQLVNDLLEALHALHIFSARLGNRRVGKIYLVAFEILWLLTSASFVSHTHFFFFARYANDLLRLTFPSQSSSG